MFARLTLLVSFALMLSVGLSIGNAGSLVGYWSFDDIQGTTVSDLSGTGNDGTVNGAPLVIEGPFGNALQLDGISDYVDCGNAESLNITNKLTVSAWVRTVDAGDPAGGQMGGQNHYVSKHNSYQFKHRTNLLIFAIWDGGPYATRISIDNSFNGEWHHVVGTYDGNVLKTYVDGNIEGEAPHAGSIDRNGLNVNIGKNPNQNDQNFEGAIDEVMIFNRDLTASHVQDLMMGNTSLFSKAQDPVPQDDDEPAYLGNQTGSAVGDEATSSFTEELIVHGGSQSMPLFYDNNKQNFSKYSEAELTLTAPRDWTASGVEELSLWFRGDPANPAEPMYVAVTDASGVSIVEYHDNPNAIQTSTWQEWVLPLSAAGGFADQGIDLTNVDRIAIGLGTRGNATVPGGAGKMYFDDIRLYRPRTGP